MLMNKSSASPPQGVTLTTPDDPGFERLTNAALALAAASTPSPPSLIAYRR
ncbi:hypothetical protein [Bradyrhizobium sp. CCGB12]|uniref:hypothetical protein n=1 Tax=Bradyrhizobium sp. CCGB12 TaxID=2949632 RepID=UPI0035BF0F27